MGVVAGLIVGFPAGPPLGVLAGIAAAGISTVAAGWLALWPLDAAATRAAVQGENIRPVAEEIIIVIAALCGLVAIVVLLLTGQSGNDVALAVAAPIGVAAGWAG